MRHHALEGSQELRPPESAGRAVSEGALSGTLAYAALGRERSPTATRLAIEAQACNRSQATSPRDVQGTMTLGGGVPCRRPVDASIVLFRVQMRQLLPIRAATFETALSAMY